ncbi:MAG: NAD(P)/FAD-dependent oxidoreductase [Coriobacteriales bacterium]|jgi:glycerol-3-phosphate dehydrogenase
MTNASPRDVIIIGAGILGCMTARALARYKLDVLVVEATGDVGSGSTKSNSGLIQTGFHARGGSLKGTSCVQGNARYDEIADELQIPFIRCGALLVAFHEEGLEQIEKKRDRAFKNGAGKLRVISGDEAREMEPRLSERVIAAMDAPTTGIISPFQLVLATSRNAAANGVQFEFGFEVEKVERAGSGYRLIAKDGREVTARYIVNMAGGMAAPIDAFVHPADLVIKPRRGQFIVFDKQRETPVSSDFRLPIKHVLFQAQEHDEGGTLLAPTVEGNLIAGPTSENVRGFFDNATTEEGLEHVMRVVRKLIPDMEIGDAITEFAGVRPNIVNIDKELKDFVVRVSAPGFVSALGIKNPGMTSSPVLADLAVSLLEKEGLRLEEDPDFDPRDQGNHLKPFLQCSPSEQREMLERDERFGHVVCRCEQITEGDIRACMHELNPPTTLDGLKRRLRVGAGRCQGSFCAPRAVEIMAEEMGCSPSDVLKNERGGRMVARRVK